LLRVWIKPEGGFILCTLLLLFNFDNLGLGENQPAFKNVIVNGLVLDAQGRK
jgi:valyl-tRNA synthetase